MKRVGISNHLKSFEAMKKLTKKQQGQVKAGGAKFN